MAKLSLGALSKLQLVASAAPVACIAALALLHGGYYPLATCACGLFACMLAAIVWLRRPLLTASLPIVPLFFAGVAAAYLVSAVVNGASLTTLAETGTWAAVAGMGFLAAAQPEAHRARSLTALSWFGIATALSAFLVFTGVLPLEGGVTNGRLEFTFTYANATAIWFGAVTLLCLLGDDELPRSLAALPVAAMLLTQSAGAVLAFLATAVVVGIVLVRTGKQELLLKALVQGVLGVALFAVVMALASPAALLAVLVAVLACLALRQQWDNITRKVDLRVVTRALVGAFVLVLAASAAILHERFAGAVYSLVERLYHVRDGLALWSTKPLLGVGPDNWQYLYRYIQTGAYDVSVVHSSPVQVLDDAGLVALACLVAACVLGVRGLVLRCRKGDGQAFAELAVTGLMLFHSVLEFDLRFGSLACMVAMLLCGPEGPVVPSAQTDAAAPNQRRPDLAIGLTAGILVTVLCLPLCVVGLACATSSTMLHRSNVARQYEQTRQRFWSNHWAVVDPSAQGEYLAACFELRDYEDVVASYERMAAPTEASTLYAAVALSGQGERTKAAETLIEALEQKPYDETLLDGARRFSQTIGIDPSVRARFDETVGRTAKRIAESDLAVRRGQIG